MKRVLFHTRLLPNRALQAAGRGGFHRSKLRVRATRLLFQEPDWAPKHEVFIPILSASLNLQSLFGKGACAPPPNSWILFLFFMTWSLCRMLDSKSLIDITNTCRPYQCPMEILQRENGAVPGPFPNVTSHLIPPSRPLQSLVLTTINFMRGS